MTKIEEIRQRDREAIPRFGPDKDPLLRAEMDRRWLLNNMYTREQVGEYQAREAELISAPLRRRIAELEAERDKWEESAGIWETEAADLLQDRTRAETQVNDLQRQLAEAVGQTEAAKQATREIMAERNTWARQLADMRDERDTAREETEKEREMYSLVSNDRDNLHAEMDTLAQDYVNNKYTVYHRGHQVARDIRRVIARWETT